MADVTPPNGSGNPPNGSGNPPAPHPMASQAKDPENVAWLTQRDWKDMDGVAKSYRSLEQMVGGPRDRLIVLPENPDSPEWQDVAKRLGRPDTPADYQIEIKDNYDPQLVESARAAFHSEGLNDRQANAIIKMWDGYMETTIAAHEAEQAAANDAQLAQLRSEWGAKFDQHTNTAAAAAAAIGLSQEDYQAIEAALGPVKTRKQFGLIAQKVLAPTDPDREVNGGNPAWGTTPEAAEAQIRAYMGDPAKRDAYLANQEPWRSRITNLQKIAAGEA